MDSAARVYLKEKKACFHIIFFDNNIIKIVIENIIT